MERSGDLQTYFRIKKSNTHGEEECRPANAVALAQVAADRQRTLELARKQMMNGRRTTQAATDRQTPDARAWNKPDGRWPTPPIHLR